MAVELKDCKNCEQPFNEAYEFCPHCGQKDKDDLTIGVLFYNTISNYFSFDARFFKSFIPLMLKPGYLARKFIEGKRLLYLHPAQMYLFIAVVLFFLYSFKINRYVGEIDTNLAKTLKKETVKDTITNEKLRDSIALEKAAKQKVKDSIAKEEVRKALKNNAFLTGITEEQADSIVDSDAFNGPKTNINFGFNEKKIDSLIQIDASDEVIYKEMGMDEGDGAIMKRLYAQVLKFYKKRQGGSILRAFYDTIPIAMFFLLPLFAFLLKLFHYKRGPYSHHLVFSFYYFSFLFTVFSIVLLVNYIVDIPDWIDTLIAFSTFVYLWIAVKRFYQQGWFVSWFKSSVTTFVFLLLIAPVGFIITGLFAFMFY